jgi:hypothetical protein
VAAFKKSDEQELEGGDRQGKEQNGSEELSEGVVFDDQIFGVLGELIEDWLEECEGVERKKMPESAHGADPLLGIAGGPCFGGFEKKQSSVTVLEFEAAGDMEVLVDGSEEEFVVEV